MTTWITCDHWETFVDGEWIICADCGAPISRVRDWAGDDDDTPPHGTPRPDL